MIYEMSLHGPDTDFATNRGPKTVDSSGELCYLQGKWADVKPAAILISQNWFPNFHT